MTRRRDTAALAAVFPGDGEMAKRTRDFDWAKTPLGPVEDWPAALRHAVASLLVSKAQILLIWGEDYISFYNDAYRPVFGTKHPSALGAPVREAWSEIWLSGLKDLFDGVIASGEAYWATDRPFYIERHGYLEETYFDVSYDPVRDESGRVRGVYCIVTETTGRVVGARRLTTLRDLGRIAQDAESVADVYRAAAEVIRDSAADIPFALLYDATAQSAPGATLAASTGAAPPIPCPQTLPVAWGPSWPLTDALALVEGDALQRFGTLHAGPWPEALRQVAVVPIATAGQPAQGWLVVGISQRRLFDEDYRTFLGLLASNISAAITAVKRTEDERRRAEMLAELDRAKTSFFSNVSHELRTPLTLMLGPLEDALAAGGQGGSPSPVENLKVAHRNSQRLLKLVNTLLDFSRIEAGRIDAVYEAVDICRFTEDLASVFRAATERAGLSLTVDCGPVRAPVYVDRDMWEKIVLNLISNAFKFTLAGGIYITLQEEGGDVVLSVRDTGTGIPAEELPNVFARFHRVRGAQGRTHEGSGIGLALVQELVKLHGGQVAVESVLGRGTTFTVRLRTGSGHLPADRVSAEHALGSTTTGAAPYVEEALRWLPGTGAGEAPGTQVDVRRHHVTTTGARVLVADDNQDMREYLHRLLSPYWTVEAVTDGEDALAAIGRGRPDLVLADVMMPRRDGFGLLRALRTDEATQTLPVILLSARAGEEARVEGLRAGADDYLTKPFSARELIASVNAQIYAARVRAAATERLRRSEERFRNIADQLATVVDRAPLGVFLVDADFRIAHLNPVARPAFGEIPGGIVGRDVCEVMRFVWKQRYADELVRIFRHTLATGESHVTAERGEFRVDRNVREYYEWRLDRITLPDGRHGLVCYFRDVSDQVRARERLSAAELATRQRADALSRLHALAERCSVPDATVADCLDQVLQTAIWTTGAQKGSLQLYDETTDTLKLVAHRGMPPRFLEFFSRVDRQERAVCGAAFAARDRIIVEDVAIDSLFDGQPAREILLDSGIRAVQSTPITSGRGEMLGMFSTHFATPHRPNERELAFLDMLARQVAEWLERKRAEEALREAAQEMQLIVETMVAPVTRCSRDLRYLWVSKPYAEWLGRPVEEINGRPIAEVIGAEAFAQLRPRFERVLRGEVVRSEDHVSFGGIGPRWITATYSPTFGVDGVCDGWVAVVIDIDERKRMENALRESERALELAGQRKDEFLAMLGHELRNPLGAIRNAIATASLDADHRPKALSIARRQTEQLAHIVDDLLDVARITQGRISLRREPLLLQVVVDRALEATRSFCEARKHTLVLDVAAEPIAVDGDATRLEQVLVNLISNACKYMNPHGEIVLTLKRVGAQAEIRVRDVGVGISPELLPQIFELFTQAAPALDRAQGGLGIGLTIARRIVEMHGGAIQAFSEGLGKGSEFVVRLPAIDAAALGDASGPAPERSDSKASRVLMVEDNEDAAESLQLLLELLGHHVRVVHTGTEAMAAARANPPEVMLIDIGLPGMTGYDVARAVRGEPTLANTILVALTGYGRDEDKHEALAAGFDYHLVKPVDPDHLKKVIRSVGEREGRKSTTVH